MEDIEKLIIKEAHKQDLIYARNFNGQAYALMDTDWIRYFSTISEVLEFLDISVEISNLCDSCKNKTCIFQTGIVRKHCDFYKVESEDCSKDERSNLSVC